MSEENNIIEAIKKARAFKGLSQRALSKLTGVTQAHISKIENGTVDIQLSSLTQIARALDLELKLVPRKSLPAVETIIKSTNGFPRDRTNLALSEIQRVQNILSKSALEELKDKLSSSEAFSSIDKINQNLINLKSLHYDTNAVVQLKKLLSPVEGIEKILKANQAAVDVFENNKASKEIEKLLNISNALENFRNNLVHSQFEKKISQLSLYSLEDNND